MASPPRCDLPALGSAPAAHRSVAEATWARLIPEDLWTIFSEAVSAIRGTRIDFLLAGAMALAAHTGRWRNTKDIDFIICPGDRDRAVAALGAAGFSDYFQQEAYDRSWIFRSYKGGVIVDLIWDLPNHRVKVDEAWFEQAETTRLRNRIYRAVSAEQMIRMKLYVMQRERCDWMDVLNILAAKVEDLDWDRLAACMGADRPLLQSVLVIFNWMSPNRAQRIPLLWRERFALPMIETDDPGAMEQRRVRLLDSRPWFAAHQPTDRPLER